MRTALVLPSSCPTRTGSDQPLVLWHLSWTTSTGPKDTGDRVQDKCRHADEEMVAFKLMMWAWKLGKVGRTGLTTPQPVLADRPGFVRAGLMRLEMGEDLSHIIRGGQVCPIAPAEDVLAHPSELQPSG